MVEIGKTMLVLSNISGIGKRSISNIREADLRAVESEQNIMELADLVAKGNKRVKLPSFDELHRISKGVDRLLETHRRLNIEMITIFDEAYPNRLRALRKPCPFFFAKGNIEALSMDGVAVIGTREISPYGHKIGMRFGQVVAEKGLTVVSGLAEGCDTTGHKGCLDKGGITIACMATPLNEVYPKSNTELAERIAEGKGCLMSEYPVGYKPTRFSFVERDRLQCGLANGVIVVETGVTGGTHHAINGALELERPVGCFSFPDDHYRKHEHSRGNDDLIRKGKARPLNDAASIDAFLESCISVPSSGHGLVMGTMGNLFGDEY